VELVEEPEVTNREIIKSAINHAQNIGVTLDMDRNSLFYQQQVVYDLLLAAYRIREMDPEIPMRTCPCFVCFSGGRCSTSMETLKAQIKQLEVDLGP
jgi:hypothetical protein